MQKTMLIIRKMLLIGRRNLRRYDDIMPEKKILELKQNLRKKEFYKKANNLFQIKNSKFCFSSSFFNFFEGNRNILPSY